MRRVSFVALLLLVSTQACVVRDAPVEELLVVEDLLVDWTIDGVEDTRLCDDYGIDLWTVDLVGPETLSLEIGCGSEWNSGSAFYGSHGLLIGTYEVTVAAIDELAAQVVAQQTVTLDIDDLDNISENNASFDFFSSDFE